MTQARTAVSTAIKTHKWFTGFENPSTLHCCLKSSYRCCRSVLETNKRAFPEREREKRRNITLEYTSRKFSQFIELHIRYSYLQLFYKSGFDRQAGCQNRTGKRYKWSPWPHQLLQCVQAWTIHRWSCWEKRGHPCLSVKRENMKRMRMRRMRMSQFLKIQGRDKTLYHYQH